MLKIYKTSNGVLEETNKIENGCWIDLANPTALEIEHIVKVCNVKEDLLTNVLDNEETSRIEEEDKAHLIIVDVPYIEDKRHKTKYITIPLGIVVTPKVIITVSLKPTEIIESIKQGLIKNIDTNKQTKFTIQILLNTSIMYLNYLKLINIEIDERESKISKATQNNELISLLNMQKSLVYFLTSLKGNDSVLERLNKGNVLTLHKDDLELLEDAIIENKQGIEMTSIYREILLSMSDTYATIISNNLNGIMKFLAAITIIFSIPTLIASFMGMNVPLGIFGKFGGSFILIVLISILISIIVALLFKKKNMM